MRTKKQGETDLGGPAWREEVSGYVFELYLGISRLMAAVHGGPPKSPRKKRRRSR